MVMDGCINGMDNGRYDVCEVKKFIDSFDGRAIELHYGWNVGWLLGIVDGRIDVVRLIVWWVLKWSAWCDGFEEMFIVVD